MCWCCIKVRSEVSSIFNSNGELVEDEVIETTANLPEHIDNPTLNRDLRNGVLGFQYENKEDVLIVYTSLEAKTFCILMKIKPMR